MPRTARLQGYQYTRLQKAFQEVDIPVKDIHLRMHTVLPYEFSPSNPKSKPIDKESLRFGIVMGGSCIYEKLIEVLEREPKSAEEGPAYPKLAARLKASPTHQLYRYVWLWSEDQSVLAQGISWFTDRDACVAKGKSLQPSYDTFDGPGAPTAMLCVEAVTPCNIHKTKGDDKTTPKHMLRVESTCCTSHM